MRDAGRTRWGVAIVPAIVALLAGGVGYSLRSRELAPTAVPAAPESLSPRDVALRSFASVVLVTTFDAKGRRLALGSGFVARQGVVVTNYHVLSGATSGTVRLIGDTQAAKVEGVLAFDVDVDLALVAVPALIAAPLTVAGADGAVIGDRIFVVGNPLDLEGTFSEGIVSGKRTLNDVRLLQITAPISSGSSGGPVLDAQARVVGVASSSLKNGQNLNFAISGDYVEHLLQTQGSLQELAKVARPKPVQVARATSPSLFNRLRRLFRLN